jgi:uncharacterized protein (TIGR02996 family)
MTPPELRALLQASKDAPDDDTPRYILADWLDDHGQPDRAEFVRLSVRLAAKEIALADEAVTRARLHELYSRHATEWLGELQDKLFGVVFRRGLLEMRSSLHPLCLLPAYAAGHVLPWLESLVFEYGQQKSIGDLLAVEALRHFTSLDVTDVWLTATWLERLVNSPRVAHLRRLRIAPTEGQKAIGVALANATQLAGLRVLDVAEGMGDGSLVALAQAPWFAGLSTLAIRYGSGIRKTAPAWAKSPHAPRLRRIDWYFVQPGKVGMRELALSPLMAEVVDMRLEKHFIGPAEAEALAARQQWSRLRRLDLKGNSIDEQAMQALAGRIRFPALRSLNLYNNKLDAAGLQALLAAPWLAGVEWLDLTYNAFGDEGAKALAAAPGLANLRHLVLSMCGISAAGIRALASSPHLARLETLKLGLDHSTPADESMAALTEGRGLPALKALSFLVGGSFGQGLTADGARRLAASPLAGRLRYLDLRGNELGDEGVTALAVPALAGLTDLDLSFNRFGEEGAAALAAGPFRRLVRLDLRGCALDDAAIRALLRRDAFPALALLDLSSPGYSGPHNEPLLKWPQLRHLAWLHADCRQDDDSIFLRLARPVAFPLDD